MDKRWQLVFFCKALKQCWCFTTARRVSVGADAKPVHDPFAPRVFQHRVPGCETGHAPNERLPVVVRGFLQKHNLLRNKRAGTQQRTEIREHGVLGNKTGREQFVHWNENGPAGGSLWINAGQPVVGRVAWGVSKSFVTRVCKYNAADIVTARTHGICALSHRPDTLPQHFQTIKTIATSA
jgi:hypothetical protein